VHQEENDLYIQARDKLSSVAVKLFLIDIHSIMQKFVLNHRNEIEYGDIYLLTYGSSNVDCQHIVPLQATMMIFWR